MICTAKRFRHEISTIASSLVLILFFSLAGVLSCQAQSAADENSRQWEVHAPGGETRCALDTEFRYYTRKGDPDKLLIHFTGGGACYNGKLCDPDTDPTPYNYKEEERDPRNMKGIFDLDHPGNPFGDYTLLVAPTCTGDVVLGDSVATYRYQTDNGEKKTVTVHHKGYVNGMTSLRWAFQHIQDPGTIVVSGSSAGGLAAPFYANIVANHYPQARVIGIGDGVGALNSEKMPRADYKSWNLTNTVRNHEAFSDLGVDNLGVQDLFIAAARQRLSNLELYQMDTAHDRIQKVHLSLGGIKKPDVLKLTKENRQEISRHYPDFHSFLIGGDGHVMLQTPRIYFFKSDGELLVEWIDSILAGEEIENMTCSNCRQPELNYNDQDLKVVGNMKELLSDRQYWNPKDDFRNNRTCSQNSPPYSLRCVLVKAADQTGGSLVDFPVTFTFKYKIREKMDDQVSNLFSAFVKYNNRDGRTFEDIVKLINEVEEDIEKQLNQ